MDVRRVAVIIEDDRDIRDLIDAVLKQSGFDVHSAATGLDGVEAVRRHEPSVVTLDLGLPDIDGFEVARRVRLFSDSYIIMLTARAEELDTLMGLESGADDYLTKPFRPRELRARVAAMLRRPRLGGGLTAVAGSAGAAAGLAAVGSSGSHAGEAALAPGMSGDAGAAAGTAAPAAGPDRSVAPHSAAAHHPTLEACEPGSLEHNGLVLNSLTRTTQVYGNTVELTRTEFDLLEALLEGGRVVRTKPELVRRLRAEDYDTGSFISDSDERAIEVHVGNLRRKLGDDSRAPKWLETVRGVGYRLAPKESSKVSC